MTATPSGRATLRPGSRLGHYEIVGLLGAGGMGEVYRARDPRLGRDVAIKVIAFDVGADPDRQRRFEQEARTVAAINHPNILSVHDVGSEAGSPYLVLELLEGESLGQQMRRERLPVRKALEIAVQIARGLAAAHQRGVVHRDVKPDNVFVTKDGGAKLLDFGLAKLVLGEEGVVETENSTLSRSTQPGALLGTPGYMSPEQIRGQAADARSDIFSFGVVLYELLTAQRPFRKETLAETMAAILNEDPPPPASLDATVAPALDRIVLRCLEKKPEERFHSAHDLALALEAVAGGSHLTGPVSSPRILARPASSRLTFATLAAFALVGVAALALRGLGPARDPWIGQPVARFELPFPERARLGSSYPSVAISPDGTTVAIVVRRGGIQQLYVRALSGSQWTLLPATEGAASPFFSPTGDWLAFFSPGKLKRVSVAGGTPQVICDVKSVRAGLLSGSWTDDGQVFFSNWPDLGLWRVPAAGGVPERLRGTEATSGPQLRYSRPQALPGGRDVLFGTWSAGSSRLETLSLETATRRTLMTQGCDPWYAPTHHIVLGWDNQILAAPFDARKLEVRGVPVPLVEGVRMSYGAGPIADYGLSRNGTLVYAPGRKPERRLLWASPTGRLDPLPLPARNYLFPKLSPDQDRVAVTIAEAAGRDVWIGDLSRGTLSRLTTDGDAVFSLWTPDAKRVVYTSGKSGQYNLFWKSVDGSGPSEPLTHSGNSQRATSVSPDGRFVLFNDLDPVSLVDVWLLGLDGERKAAPLLKTAASEQGAAFSPDGKWVSYVSDETGRFEVYLQPYPGPGEKKQISTEGGAGASWNPNGREIFYIAGEQMMSVAFEAGHRLRIGKPRPLFLIGPPAEPLETSPNYSVAAHGERFLFAEHHEPASAEGRLHVVVNWFDELRRRVPAP